jgi:hypothetical protein
VPLVNIDLPYYLGVRSPMVAMAFGAVCVITWLAVIPAAVWAWKKDTPFMRSMGPIRYGIVATLFMIQAGVVAKMILRLALNIKYVLVIPNILNV